MNKYARLSASTFALIVLLAILHSAISAQQQGTTIGLQAAQYKVSRLASGHIEDQSIFVIDKSDSVIIEIIASIDGLATSIEGPAGQILDESSIAGFNGTFTTLQGDTQGSSIILGNVTPGFHYIFAFPWLGAGNYTVHFKAPSTLNQEVAVITQVSTNSSVGTALFATEPVVVLGNPSVLTAAVFDGQTPIQNASVALTIVSGPGSQTSLTLLDNGSDADDKAGDGLYSGQFIPNAAGNYLVKAQITGSTAGGVSFTRHSTTEITVVAQNGKLTGTVQDKGVDDNADSLIDRIAIDLGVNAINAGTYRAFVHLKTANGQSLVRSADVNLNQGTQKLTVSFEADAITQLGEDGPFAIELIELFFIDPAGALPSDRLINAGQTQAYHLSDFQHPAIALTGTTSDHGVDDNNNGLFERLVVSVQVRVPTAGTYDWTFKLSDQNFNEIDFAAGSGVFSVGVNTMQVEFKGSKIGDSKINGPYLLTDLLLEGPSISLVANTVGTTQPYQFNQFESSKSPSVVTLASSQNPSGFGQSVTFTAAVNPSGSTSITPSGRMSVRVKPLGRSVTKLKTSAATVNAVPTGTVSFFDGSTNLGTATLNASGQATLTTNTLSVGTHPITASYSGDDNFNSGVSGPPPLAQVVTRASTTTVVTSSLPLAFVGSTVTYTATITLPGSGTPTGTIQFRDNGLNIGVPIPVIAGKASVVQSGLTPGRHTITASYSGDGNFFASTGTLVGGQDIGFLFKDDSNGNQLIVTVPANGQSGSGTYTFIANGVTIANNVQAIIQFNSLVLRITTTAPSFNALFDATAHTGQAILFDRARNRSFIINTSNFVLTSGVQ